MAYLKLLYYYKLAALKYLFGLFFTSSAFNDSVKASFTRQTFRFPNKAIADSLIAPKLYRSFILAQFKKQKIKINPSNNKVALFDGDLKETEMRNQYVKRLSGEESKLQIGRSELVKSVSVIISTLTIISLIISFPFIFCLSILSKNKTRYPLHVLNTIEAVHILFLLRKHGIKKLHFFCIYENDANLLAYVLMRNGIVVNKIPSEVPLSFWNQVIVANSLSLCFKYQEEEYNLYKPTMYVNELHNWVPENAFETEPFYRSKAYRVKEKTIGFYSSAMWLREKLGRINLKDNAYQNEQMLFKYLLNFISENSACKLVVFLHPLEKQYLEWANIYYGQLASNIEIADVNIPNAQQFFNADVGVTMVSTLSYERLFWGFKTLICPIGKDNFPISGSSFNNICEKTEKELGLKIKNALSIDSLAFFKTNGIKDYIYTNYPVFNN